MTVEVPVIQARALCVGYGRRQVGADISIEVARGQVLCLLGPNGSGKTTLFKTLLGLLPPLSGQVLMLGQPVAGWSRNAFARHVGYVPQAHEGMFPFTVEEVVLMGRAAHVGRFAAPSRHDRQMAAHGLETLGIAHLAQRIYTAISGGERQLVLLARALAQEPALLVMDEPTASLDFGNQIRVLEHIAQLRHQGITVLMSTHQPQHALRIADRIVLLADGRIAGFGPPATTATPRALAELYGVTEQAVVASLPIVGSLSPGPCP